MKIDTVGIYQVLLSYKANGFNEAMVKKQLGGNAYSAEEIEIGLSVFRAIAKKKNAQDELNARFRGIKNQLTQILDNE